jgi:aspartyl-tRNA(Asn)/glutamyl-tRNA(Gln) amidotransferase subunit A
MKIPRLSGKALVAMRAAAEGKITGAAVRAFVRASMGIDRLGALPESFRAPLPMQMRPVRAREPAARPSAGLPLPATPSSARTAERLAEAYRQGHVSPRSVAERVLAGLETLAERRPSMNVLACKDPEATLREAEASAARWRSGAALGALDGIPFLVKDQFDVTGMPTRCGAVCGPETPATRDSTIVARLRRAGAVFAGKTVLTEWGMSPIGASIHHAMPHNAHDPTRAAGGSSTGSAVAVALGLAPIAAGSDGGGSIRIPAALNGIFGIKPTFGRVSRAGDKFAGSSLSHAGPLGASTLDLVAFLDAVASTPDGGDATTAWAPPPPEGGFGAALGAGVRGLRIGVDDGELADADPEVARAVEEALRALEKEGAELVRIDLPLARYAPAIGYLVIVPESLASQRDAWLRRRDRIADDTRLTFAVMGGFSTFDQKDAMRLREGLRRDAAEALRRVDVLALPTTATTAPRYAEAEEGTCFNDPFATAALCRFNFLGNLTGLPAGTAPVGVGARGLPIGLQIVGDAWDEATVLGVMAHLERIGAAAARRPKGAIDLLEG